MPAIKHLFFLHMLVRYGKFITIKQYKNKGKNTLDGEYSSKNAEFMNKKEMIAAVAETDKSLEKSLLESRIY